MTELQNRPFTFGEKACGVNFNPGGDPTVAQIKADFAALVDALHNTRATCNSEEKARMLSIAITNLQTAQMWAVKAVTWGH
jgi:hypothetical protein